MFTTLSRLALTAVVATGALAACSTAPKIPSADDAKAPVAPIVQAGPAPVDKSAVPTPEPTPETPNETAKPKPPTMPKPKTPAAPKPQGKKPAKPSTHVDVSTYAEVSFRTPIGTNCHLAQRDGQAAFAHCELFDLAKPPKPASKVDVCSNHPGDAHEVLLNKEAGWWCITESTVYADLPSTNGNSVNPDLATVAWYTTEKFTKPQNVPAHAKGTAYLAPGYSISMSDLTCKLAATTVTCRNTTTGAKLVLSPTTAQFTKERSYPIDFS